MGYLDRILEQAKKKTQEVLDKEKEKIENEEVSSFKDGENGEVKIENNEDSPAKSELNSNDLASYANNWASKQTSKAVEKAIQAIEKAKEQVQNEQETPKVEENSDINNGSLPSEDNNPKQEEDTSGSASENTGNESSKTASNWLKNLLEKREKEVLDAIKKAEDKVKNENTQNPTEPEPDSSTDSEEKKNWLSNKTENAVDATIKELEDVKEKLENGEMEIPTPPQETPPSEEQTPPSGNDNRPQEPSGSENDNQGANGNQNQGSTDDGKDNDKDSAYPSVEGETVIQDGVGESEKQTEKDIMNGKTPTDKDGNAIKLPVILPEYELMVYDALSDEEIVELVRSQLQAYKNAGESAINATADSEKSSAQSKRGSVEQSKSANERATNDLYDQAKNKIDSDMIKRGLARSSIASLLVSNSENARAKTLADNDLQYRNALQDIDDKIAQAKSKRQKALESFNIEYAVKYAEEVRKLQQERAEKEEEVIKYNNSIKEKLYDDKLAGLKTQETLSKDSSKSSNKDDEDEYFNNGSVNSPIPATGTSAEKLYNIYRDILLEMDKDEARYELRNDTLYSKTLPTAWYLKLVNEFGR